MKRRLALTSALALLSLAPPLRSDTRATAGSRVSISLEPNTVVVQGAEPNGQVVWFGAQSDLDADFSVSRASSHGATQADAGGMARIAFDKPLKPRAIWIAVDLKSGRFATTSPPGYRLTQLDRDHAPCRGDSGRNDDGLVDSRQQIEGLMVRPGDGAWWFAVADGGSDDEDRRHDGHLRLPLPKFMPIESGPEAPSKLRGDDLWFVIDPVAMDLSLLKGGIAQ